MIAGPGSFVSPEIEMADDVIIGASTQLIGRGSIAHGVRIGCGTVIEGSVSIAAGCKIGHHVVISGRVSIAEENEIGHGSVIGGAPDHPDHRYSNGRIEIGSRNVFREHCTINMPTTTPLTQVGSDGYFMNGVHLAHDCKVGNYVKIAMLTSLAGHVEVDDYTYLGMHTAVHQRRHIGPYCMIGMGSVVRKHVPPFATLAGALFRNVNVIGLRLRGIPEQVISQIEAAYGFRPQPATAEPETSTSLSAIRAFLDSHPRDLTYASAGTFL